MSTTRSLLHLITCAAVALGCGKSTSTPLPNACDSLILASAAATEFLDLTTIQRESAARAMDKRERWDREEISPKQDGTGEFSRADARARSYQGVGIAMCQSASTALWQMRELIRIGRDAELTRISYRLGTIDCTTGYIDAISPDASKRRASLDAWQTRQATARDAMHEVVNRCLERKEGTREIPLPPPILLPSE